MRYSRSATLSRQVGWTITSLTLSRTDTETNSPNCPGGEPFARLTHLLYHIPFARTYSDEGLPAFEELFLYACPKFISANPPPYEDQEQLAAYAEDPPPEPAQHHLALFLADVRAQAAVPTLRSFLKLYTSLDAAKLAGFLDADEEEMVQQMMAVKAASRSVSRVGNEQNLLDGQMISTSDMDFVINEVRPNFLRAHP
jgi:RNA polymerase I-associated factor PAF67